MSERTDIITGSGRTVAEITASVRMHMKGMVNNAVEIGLDLLEMKEACKHGEWLPWLKEIGLSASTAGNYMRVAKNVKADSKMAQLPYTKILALMAAPADQQEELTEMAEDLSAAEIRRLTEEKNKAAEAVNIETARADQAEKEAKEYYQDAAALRNKVNMLQSELDYHRQTADQLRGELFEAENNRVEVEVEKKVEVAPADYDRLKAERQELLEAATRAEERAVEAEDELERMRLAGSAPEIEKPVGIRLNEAVNAFLSECDMMPFDPAGLQKDMFAIEHGLELMKDWLERMQGALDTPVIEGAVV